MAIASLWDRQRVQRHDSFFKEDHLRYAKLFSVCPDPPDINVFTEDVRPLPFWLRMALRLGGGALHARTEGVQNASGNDSRVIRNSADVARLFVSGSSDLRSKRHEELHVVWMDRGHRIIATEKVTAQLKHYVAESRDGRVLGWQTLHFSEAQLFGSLPRYAKYICLVHNHPGEKVPIPSKDDMETTDALRRRSEANGLTLFEHVIIGKEGYLSYREMSRYQRYSKEILLS